VLEFTQLIHPPGLPAGLVTHALPTGVMISAALPGVTAVIPGMGVAAIAALAPGDMAVTIQ